VRFRKLDDLPLDLLAESIAALSVEQFIALVEAPKLARKRG
jgi:hypothetical protein